jgi:hypothetical protein
MSRWKAFRSGVNLAYAPRSQRRDPHDLPTSIHRGKLSPENQVKTVGLLETLSKVSILSLLLPASPFENLIGSAYTVILPILDSGNLAYAPRLNDAIRMTYLRPFTVGSLKAFKGFNDSLS